MKFLFPLGRVLFSLIFIIGGLRHFTQEGIQHAATLGVPAAEVLVPLSGVMAIVGGLSVALGYKTRWGAWILVAFLVPVTWWMHGFWRLTDPAEIHVQQAMFAKNLSMLGAALLMTQFGAIRQVSMREYGSGADISKPEGDASFARKAALPKGFPLWSVAGVMLVAFVILIATGLLGSVGREGRDTHYRSSVGAQQPYKVVSLGGAVIAYADSGGAGPVLICLHAIGHGARDFEDLSRRLSPEYRVLAIDFPGQGNSGPDTQPASATRYTQILAEFIDRLDLKSVILVGNSIGGAVSIRYASTHPARVKALVLCDSGGLGNPGPISRIFIAGFVQFFAAGRRGAFWYPWAFERYYRSVLITDTAREERNRIVRSAYEIAATLEQAWRSFGRAEENLLPILSNIRCPVLLAWARQDFVLPLKDAQPAFKLFRNHQLQVFDGGHAAFLEDPDRFEKSLRKFLGVGR